MSDIGYRISDIGYRLSAKRLVQTKLNRQSDTIVFVLQGYMFRSRYRPSSGKNTSHEMAGAHAVCSTSADVFSLTMGDV